VIFENCGFSDSAFVFAEELKCQRLAEEILKNPFVSLSIS
jgi:hypothetical protein